MALKGSTCMGGGAYHPGAVPAQAAQLAAGLQGQDGAIAAAAPMPLRHSE